MTSAQLRAEGGRNGGFRQNDPHPTLREFGKNLFCAACVLATITAGAFLLMTVLR
jgi:hypothetical protein